MTDKIPTNGGIMQAIQNVQQQAEYIKKDSKGQVGQGKFNYSSLISTWESIKQLAKDNDLVVYQTPSDVNSQGHSGNYFKSTLYHIPTGESVTEYMQMLLTRQDPQAVGAAITYYRRYMLTAQLGLIPDDDNDAREHRLATAQQKTKIVGAVKLTFPEVTEPAKINEKLEAIAGKHPSFIRESEADGIVELIAAYKDKLEKVN